VTLDLRRLNTKMMTAMIANPRAIANQTDMPSSSLKLERPFAAERPAHADCEPMPVRKGKGQAGGRSEPGPGSSSVSMENSAIVGQEGNVGRLG
jgi:hypothetical protein